MAAKRRIRPLRALRAVRELIQDPDDTSKVFEVIQAMSGNHIERMHRRMAGHEPGARLLAEAPELLPVLTDRERLLALPEGTLGRTYGEFMSAEQISADGLVDASESMETVEEALPAHRWLGERLRDMHDLWHVTTGYGRDLVGEASLLAFTYAQTRHRGIGLIALFAWLNLGDAPGARGLIWKAFRRGRKAAWLPGQDWEALLEAPLSQVRSELRVGEPPRYEAVRSDAAPTLASA